MPQLRVFALLLLASPGMCACVRADGLAEALVEQSRWQLSSRLAIQDRDFGDAPSENRQQAGLGLILDYRSGRWGNGLSLQLSGYHLQKLWASGRETADLLPADNGGSLETFSSQIGEATLEWQWPNGCTWQVGRQRADSLLLRSSGQRALPDTFEGVGFEYQGRRLRWSGHWFNRWSPRNDDNFRPMGTDLEKGVIDHLAVMDIRYQYGYTSVDGGWLAAHDYLTKYGLRLSHRLPLTEIFALKLTGGYFVSEAHGRAFRVGAEKDELDDEDGAPAGTATRHHGEGGYLQLDLERGPWRLTLAHSRFGNAWLEDNFAGDHGTNPFPTRSILFPDLSNTGERAWQFSLAYDWHQWLQGLTSVATITRGGDAENSYDPLAGRGTEGYRELLISYRPPSTGGLGLQWRYQHYRSDVDGAIDGIKGDLKEHRVFIDYTYRF